MLESAANQLVSDGLVDRDKIGIIGFSRTCFYVMEMLTTEFSSPESRLDHRRPDVRLFAIHTVYGSSFKRSGSMIGAPPFGEGLQQWLKRSPGFNLDKMTTPLLVVGEGPVSLLSMWEPYAGLRYLHKPVDLVMLNTDEHVLTNPAVRMASQGGSVDWFRFWLRMKRILNPAKAEQYARWRELTQADKERKRSRRSRPRPTKVFISRIAAIANA